LARKKNRDKQPPPLDGDEGCEQPLKVGDRVYRENMDWKKGELRWLPGYKVREILTERQVRIVNTKTGTRHRVNVRHLRWVDPVSELIDNTNIDAFPGQSKLYFAADDLKDLNWEAMKDLPRLSVRNLERAEQITRDREGDLFEQHDPDGPPPPKRKRYADGSDRPIRFKRRIVRYKAHTIICHTCDPTKLSKCKHDVRVLLPGMSTRGTRQMWTTPVVTTQTRKSRWDQRTV